MTALFSKKFCSDWQNIDKIRQQLTTYLQCLGFGKGLKLFGKGAPPKGWPSDLDWTEFKGPKRSSYIKKCNIVIKSILEGKGINFYSTPSTEGVESTRGNSVCLWVCLSVITFSFFEYSMI